jgi:FixJ family two-component response regulator
LQHNNLMAFSPTVGMPGLSGWELAHAIRQRNETIPIAVITGWGEAVGSDEQKEALVDWVVTKPFRAERISELAQEISKRSGIAKRAAFSVVAA